MQQGWRSGESACLPSIIINNSVEYWRNVKLYGPFWRSSNGRHMTSVFFMQVGPNKFLHEHKAQ